MEASRSDTPQHVFAPHPYWGNPAQRTSRQTLFGNQMRSCLPPLVSAILSSTLSAIVLPHVPSAEMAATAAAPVATLLACVAASLGAVGGAPALFALAAFVLSLIHI